MCCDASVAKKHIAHWPLALVEKAAQLNLIDQQQMPATALP
jgi:hypothetical protein